MFLYHGRQVIVPEKLVELDTIETVVSYGVDNAFVSEQRYRDMVKMLMVMTDKYVAYYMLVEENEGKSHYVAHSLYQKSKLQDKEPLGDEFISGF